MLTALIFIVVIGILVFVHEAGHFFAAKKAGMKVEEFGFGFPPRILAWRRRPGADIAFPLRQAAFGAKSQKTDNNNTVYSVNLIPFGGFVKILGEDGSEKNNPHSFASKSTGVRSIVIIAGVIMNLLLAVALLIVNNGIGLRVGLGPDLINQAKDIKIQIVQVVKNSPAQQAGLRALDEIVGFETVAEVQDFIGANRGQEIELAIVRGAKISKFRVTPRINPPPGEGALGISLALTGVVKYPWHQAVYKGIQDTYFITRETAIGYGRIIGNLFTTGQVDVELSGPVGIAIITGQAARTGLTYLIQLVALISINLAILNIIPFPALDGGRLLFIIIEKIKGSPVPKQVETVVNTVGFVLLLTLMVFITTKDIIKFF